MKWNAALTAKQITILLAFALVVGGCLVWSSAMTKREQAARDSYRLRFLQWRVKCEGPAFTSEACQAEFQALHDYASEHGLLERED